MPESRDGACVFCMRREQPPTLFETPLLFAMPDKFPLVPGHVLIIPKEHVRCYGAAPLAMLDALEAATSQVSRFLSAVYGGPVLINEVGAAGQTVFHAHLHLTPWPMLSALPPLPAHPDVTPVAGWEAVQDHFARHGRYYYVAAGGQKHVVSSYDSPALDAQRQALAEALGVGLSGHTIARAATSADALAVADRWVRWTG